MLSFQELSAQFEDFLLDNLNFNTNPETLYEPCKYLLQSGGKRVRPVICLMGNELFSPIKEETWYVALAYELFHNFTLVHDDIMDNSLLRRGKETVHAKYGITSGILSGDVLSIYAYKALEKAGDKLSKIFKLYNQTAIEVCEGQQLDMDYEKSIQITTDKYLKMIELKTSVLLASCLASGAIMGGADDKTVHHLYEFGKNLGIAFQLRDDYLDTFGEVSKTGKIVGNDIKSNKKTFLLVETQRVISDNDSKILNKILENNASDKVNKVIDIYLKYNIDKTTEESVNQYYELSLLKLNKVDIPKSQKLSLYNLAHQLINREY